jgi:hypothetical protein
MDDWEYVLCSTEFKSAIVPRSKLKSKTSRKAQMKSNISICRYGMTESRKIKAENALICISPAPLEGPEVGMVETNPLNQKIAVC